MVTGGASGIGRAISIRLAAEGAFVIVADQDLAAAEKVATSLGPNAARAARLDQAEEDSVREVVNDLDRLDVLCVNAGIALGAKDAVDVSPAEWARVHAVNLQGSFLMARAAVPLLGRPSGAIVFTASTSGLRAHPGAAPYAASKAGLIGFARALALEVAGIGIRVNCVCPGGVRTPMLAAVEPDTDLEARTLTPLGPLAEPEDVAAAVSYLASDDARHVTATELVIDGGESAGVRRG